MAENLLILKEAHIKWAAKKLDDAFDFTEIVENRIVGAAIEALDGKGAEITIDFGVKRVSEHVPVQYIDEIHAAMDDVIDEDDDYGIAVDNAISVIDDLKDKLDIKPIFKAIIDSSLEMIKAAILIYLDSREKTQ